MPPVPDLDKVAFLAKQPKRPDPTVVTCTLSLKAKILTEIFPRIRGSEGFTGWLSLLYLGESGTPLE